MKSKKLKKAIIIGILSQVLCIALLLSVTFGKYFQEILGYTRFEVEKFNAAILPPLLTEENSLEVTWSARDFLPGMTRNTSDSAAGDTSARTSFRVANGTTEQNATSLALQYSIRIRTSQTLPLKYTLRDGDNYYSTMGEPKQVTVTGMSDARYEYMFGTSATETAAGGETISVDEEATFILQRSDSDTSALIYRVHELIAEWPVVVDENNNTASTAYMKEVEVVEIVVIVTTANENTDDSTHTKPDTYDYYSDGVFYITLPNDSSSSTNSYSHTVDLRAFKPTSGENSATAGEFNFYVDNAMGLNNIPHTSQTTTSYSMNLKVPAALIDENYKFDIFRNDVSEATSLITEDTVITYRVYDEKTGEYDDFETLALAEAKLDGKPEYKLYYIYNIAIPDDTLLNYQTDAGQQRVEHRDYHGYTITISKLEGIDNSTTNERVFLNKLEVLIEAQFDQVSE